jgi:hypothetical protein
MKHKKLCFYHWHVNGDCWWSRLIVGHVIKHTKHLDMEYFYNAHRSINSHCEDLGLPRENFNVMPLITDHRGVHFIYNAIYVNVWIGHSHTDSICSWCLKSLNIYYNTLINEINNKCELSIPPITSEVANDSCIAHVPFDYSKFDSSALEQIKHFIEIKKNTYKKIILVQNFNVSTKIFLNNVDHAQYIYYLSTRYPEYLFMPYNNISHRYSAGNIFSLGMFFGQIENNDLHRNGMHMIYASYLSTFCDKVICLASGPALYTFNEENKHVLNKFFFLDAPETPGAAVPTCINEQSKDMCVKKYNLHYNYHCYADNSLFVQKIEEFIST